MLFDTRRFHQSGNPCEPGEGGWLFSSSLRWPRPDDEGGTWCVVNRAKAWKEIEKDAQVEERKKMGVMSVSGRGRENTRVSERERERFGQGSEKETGSRSRRRIHLAWENLGA